jgi:uncharacterized coiled-coil DUF342 family protein
MKKSQKNSVYRRENTEKEDKLKATFNKIKEEFEDHLDSINENTNEIHSNYEYLCELDSKIDKLNEKLEEVMMFIQHLSKKNIKLKKHKFTIKSLTRKEQEIFLALYTLGQNKEPVTYTGIARFLCITPYLTQNYITNLIEKGIPIQKRYADNEVNLTINTQFRELQAKKNIVKINESVSKKIASQR